LTERVPFVLEGGRLMPGDQVRAHLTLRTSMNLTAASVVFENESDPSMEFELYTEGGEDAPHIARGASMDTTRNVPLIGMVELDSPPGRYKIRRLLLISYGERQFVIEGDDLLGDLPYYRIEVVAEPEAPPIVTGFGLDPIT
jgi:hypothetical protein